MTYIDVDVVDVNANVVVLVLFLCCRKKIKKTTDVKYLPSLIKEKDKIRKKNVFISNGCNVNHLNVQSLYIYIYIYIYIFTNFVIFLNS